MHRTRLIKGVRDKVGPGLWDRGRIHICIYTSISVSLSEGVYCKYIFVKVYPYPSLSRRNYMVYICENISISVSLSAPFCGTSRTEYEKRRFLLLLLVVEVMSPCSSAPARPAATTTAASHRFAWHRVASRGIAGHRGGWHTT